MLSSFRAHNLRRSNGVERSFGVLKKQWNIFDQMPPYQYPTQVKIVVTCMAIHNFIIKQHQMDEVLEQVEIDEAVVELNEETDNEDDDPVTLDDNNMGAARDGIRDQIHLASNAH